MIYVLYHANCQDGLAAAHAAWLTLRDSARYIPVQYGHEPPDMEPDSEVYILDFSYDFETLCDMYDQARLMVVIDHHGTAAENLGRFKLAHPKAIVCFTEDYAGCVQAWWYFHAQKPVPRLYEYVQDRDLWRWKRDNSREINDALRSYPLDIRTFDRLVSQAQGGLSDFIIQGKAIRRHVQQQVERLCDYARLSEVGGFEVPVVPSPLYASEIGEHLLKSYPEAPFAAIPIYTPEGTIWQLRSRTGGFNVGALAKSLGGGGHQAAAGFKTEKVEI